MTHDLERFTSDGERCASCSRIVAALIPDGFRMPSSVCVDPEACRAQEMRDRELDELADREHDRNCSHCSTWSKLPRAERRIGCRRMKERAQQAEETVTKWAR